MIRFSWLLLCAIVYANAANGQSDKIVFREDWKEIKAATPVTQEHVSNPNLMLTLHGPGKEKIKKSNHPEIPNDPYYIWSGDCLDNWGVSLRHKQYMVDLTGQAFVAWRSRHSGFRQLRLMLKLADGTWLVSDQYDGASDAWHETRFDIADVRWRDLDIARMVEGKWHEHPDLSRVDEIGFTDLMVGGGTPASSRLDWIEVHGKHLERK